MEEIEVTMKGNGEDMAKVISSGKSAQKRRQNSEKEEGRGRRGRSSDRREDGKFIMP